MVTHRTITKDPKVWKGHPDIAFFNDKLFIAHRESGRHKADNDTRVKVLSTRVGTTNESPTSRVVMRSDEGRYNCPRLTVVGKKLWLLCDFVVSKDSQDFIDAENDTQNTRIEMCCTLDGINWSPSLVTNITGIVPDRILATQDGHFLIATHHFEPRGAASASGKLGSLVQDVWRAKDIETGAWTKHNVVSSTILNLCEASLCYADYKIICMMRENSQRGYPAFVSFSEDHGISWSDIEQTRLYGCHRPVLGRLSSGNFLVTYREQVSPFEGSYWARNTFAALSDPFSALTKPHFDCNNILPLDHDNSPKPDGGYTGWVEVAKDDVYIVNYITNGEKKAYIKMYRVNIAKDFGIISRKKEKFLS